MIINKKLFVLLAIVGPFVIFVSFVFETETLKDINVKKSFNKEENSLKIQNFTSEKERISKKVQMCNFYSI